MIRKWERERGSCTQWKQGHSAKKPLRRIAHDGEISGEDNGTKSYTAGRKHKRQSRSALKCIQSSNEMGERRTCYLMEKSKVSQVPKKKKLKFSCLCFIALFYIKMLIEIKHLTLIIKNKGERMEVMLGEEQANNI